MPAAWSRRSTVRDGLQAHRLDRYKAYLQERITAYPQLSGRRLLRGDPRLRLRRRLYRGDRLPRGPAGDEPFAEVRFETPPGRQAQVDFAQFQVIFADETGGDADRSAAPAPGRAAGCGRASSCIRTCRSGPGAGPHAAFADLGGVPAEILYDWMKTAVIGEAAEGGIVYNRTLLDFAGHYRFHPKAPPALPGEDQGRGVERPFRYIRQTFSRPDVPHLDDLNAQLAEWLASVANVCVHATTRRVVAEAR